MDKRMITLTIVLIVVSGCKFQVSNEQLVENIRTAYEADNIVRAKRKIDKLIANSPNYAPAYIWKSRVETSLENYSKAMQCIKTAINIDSTSIDAYLLRAQLKVILGDYKSALADCDYARFLKKDVYQIYLTKGEAYISLLDISNAIIQFEHAVKYGENSGKTHFELGQLHLKLGNKDEACNYLSKAGELGHIEAYDIIKLNCNEPIKQLKQFTISKSN